MKRLSITIASILFGLLGSVAQAQHQLYGGSSCGTLGGWASLADLMLDRTPGNTTCSIAWTGDHGLVTSDGTNWLLTGPGSVTSVGMTVPSVFSISGSPISGSGVLALDFASGQLQNKVLATPNGSSGQVALRALAAADIPSPISSSTSGNAGTATALATVPTQCTGTNFSTGITVAGNANCSTPATVPPAVGSPNARSLTLATAFQATDNTRSAVVNVNLSSTATLSLSGGTTNSASVVIGSTSAVASGTGTVIGNYSNSNTGSLTIGLNLSTISAVPVSFMLPKNWFFAVLQTSGTVSISSGYDQAVG